jgi:predicted lipoprotein with Yx(FWY)xxD motif
MKRLMTLGTAIPVVLALAGCGGAKSGGVPSATTPTTGFNTVAVRQLPGLGRVLVNNAGEALYTPDLEANGKILCLAACNAFWKPLTLSRGNPTAVAGVGKVGLIKRPDGSMQVAVNGRPLYTFVEDSPGNATGNGFHDEFGGHRFTWNVVHAGGTTTSVTASRSGASTPSTTTGSSGSYGY